MQRYREPEHTIRRFRAGTLSSDALFRAVAEFEAWQLALLPDGSPYFTEQTGAIWDEHQGRYLEVLTQPDAPYYEPLGVRWEAVDGRTLIREHLPNYEGMRLTNGGWVNQLLSSRVVGGRLREWARILDLEDALQIGTEPEVLPLLDSDWYVLYRDGEPWLEGREEGRYVLLFSAPDRPGEFISNELGRLLGQDGRCTLPEVRRVDGRTLFTSLAERGDFDGIAINSGSESPPRTWGPHAARELLEGTDPRLERRLLRARSRSEMRLLMDQLGASYDQTSSYETTVNGQPVIEFSSWSPDDSFSLRFHAVAPESIVKDEAKSEFVCAGLLAYWVKLRLEALSLPPASRPGNMLEWAREGLRWLDELDKSVDASSDQIPRTAVRLPRGSATVRREPELLSGGWLRRSRSQMEALLSNLE